MASLQATFLDVVFLPGQVLLHAIVTLLWLQNLSQKSATMVMGCHTSFLDCNVVIGRLWIPQNNKYKVVYLLSRISAALLVVKNKSISPLWELNYFHVNSSKKNSNVLTPSMHGCLVIWTVAKTNNKIVCYFI